MDLGIIEKLAKCIVRPPKSQYKPNDLVPPCFELKHRVYQHHSFDVVNSRGLKLKGSYVKDRHSTTARDTIIFLHANGSCRLVMKNYIEMFLPHYDMVSFDFAGCGHSEGEFITLGYNQRQDVYAIINRIRLQYGVKNVFLWGRSMGAATAILYTAKYGGIKGIISDNSYSDLDILINELSDDYLPFLPTFLVDNIISSIQLYIEEKVWKVENTDFNMRKLKPISVIQKVTCPIVFIGSTEDTFVNVKHTKELYAKTKSTKWLELVKGNHNDPRTSDTKLKILKYLKEMQNQPSIRKCTSREKFDFFRETNHPSLVHKKDEQKEEKKEENKQQQMNSPLEVKLVNCAQLEHHKIRSPILSKTEEKVISKDISSMDTNHSERRPRESIMERRMRVDQMNKRTRTRSNLKRRKIFEGIQYINQHLNGQED